MFSLPFALAVLVCACAGLARGSSDVVMKPLGPAAATVGVVVIQGANISTAAYIPLAQALQKALLASHGVATYVGIPAYPGDIAEPPIVGLGIARIVAALRAAGLGAADPLFVAGHSLGGVGMQAYVAAHPGEFAGQILYGAYVLRAQLNGTVATPTLTVGAELDGLTRVTRVAESFYHQILHPRGFFARNATSNYPVTCILGMSHMQFASGAPPPKVKAHDLQPEISYDDAHALVAADTAAFVAAHVAGPQQAPAAAAIAKRVAESGDFFAPLVYSFELEGSYHLRPPCYNDPPSANCTLSCPWTRIAQVLMGGVQRAGLAFNVSDAFHPVSQINPVHLPHVLNNCTDPAVPCTLQMVTVSQCMYDPLDADDTALTPVSAYEIRAKLKSRQVVYEATGLPADFNKTDAPSICASINAHALDWALNASATGSRARFQRIGEPYVFGEDLGPYNAGPVWIGAPVIYKNIVSNSTGQPEVEIRSPMMKTPSKFVVPAAAGMHYCKLLSPARALEWIYVDSLRLHGSINATRDWN